MNRIAVCIALIALSVPGVAWGQVYDSYFVYRGADYPNGAVGWSHHAEGIAHDEQFWYIAQSSQRYGGPSFPHIPSHLWKIPVEVDLGAVTSATPGVVRREIAPDHILVSRQYEKFGDPVVYQYNGAGYLVVPISGNGSCESSPAAAVAFFRCSDLGYVDYAILPGQCGDAGWVAVNAAGELVSSRDHIGLPEPSQQGLRVYTVGWSALETSSQAIVAFDRTIPVLNESGAPLELLHIQGGEFDPGGRLLYVSSGYYDEENAAADREGIHVIDTATFRRVRHSARGVAGQLFNFYYNPGADTYEEPQGLTIWNLDQGAAPGIYGQLHAIVRRYGWDAGDQVYLKHYTRALAVNSQWAGCHTGSPSCPFQTIPAALSRAWNGAEIRIRAGVYAAPLTIASEVRFSAEAGVVRIGN